MQFISFNWLLKIPWHFIIIFRKKIRTAHRANFIRVYLQSLDSYLTDFASIVCFAKCYWKSIECVCFCLCVCVFFDLCIPLRIIWKCAQSAQEPLTHQQLRQNNILLGCHFVWIFCVLLQNDGRCVPKFTWIPYHVNRYAIVQVEWYIKLNPIRSFAFQWCFLAF